MKSTQSTKPFCEMKAYPSNPKSKTGRPYGAMAALTRELILRRKKPFVPSQIFTILEKALNPEREKLGLGPIQLRVLNWILRDLAKLGFVRVIKLGNPGRARQEAIYEIANTPLRKKPK